MAITLFLLVFKLNSQPERLLIPFHIIAWGLPAILTALPFITDSYGPAGILYVIMFPT
jgi:hypothetical protein